MTNEMLVTVAEQVLEAKKKGMRTVRVNDVLFDDNIYDGNGGRCQENARKLYWAATKSNTMPGMACCAGRTYLNLNRDHSDMKVASSWAPVSYEPGDYIFLDGGPRCRSCGSQVGHVMVWLGSGRCFQHTSRARLGITDEGPTQSQRARVRGVFRLLPVKPTPSPTPDWAKDDVDWVMEQGYLSVDETGDFRARDFVTRAELAIVIRRILTRSTS